MKIRNGFVSNSSSSSFVIGVPAGTPLMLEEFHKAIYGTTTPKSFGPEYASTRAVESYEVVQDILEQIADAANTVREDWQDKTGKLTPEDLINEVDSTISYQEMDSFRKDPTDHRSEMDWDAYNAADLIGRTEEAAKLAKQFEGMDIYSVTYSDNDGSFGCEVEHGDALRQPNIVRFSHH